MELIKNLSNVGYYKAVSENQFDEGTQSSAFFEIISWLSIQLKYYCNLESYVNFVSNEDAHKFFVGVRYLLKELCCPYKSLVTELSADRFIKANDKKLLILYLCTELESAKIQAFRKTNDKGAFMKIERNKSQTVKELREMLRFVLFPKPLESITPQIFSEVEKKLKELSYPLTPKEKVGEFLFSDVLIEKQWFQLENLHKEMHREYKTRRNLLITRLHVTISSFIWSDRLKPKAKEILNIYNRLKRDLTSKPSVKLFHVLAAKPDLAVIEKTSSASVRKNTKSSVNSVIIGAVPDRGGRHEEQQPPLEVPSWQKNDSSYKRRTWESNHQMAGSSYSRDKKTIGYSQDEITNPCLLSNPFKRNVFPKNRYKNNNNKSNYNFQPVYQPINHRSQSVNPQFGVDGYMPAGDNFHLYGMTDSMSQLNLSRGRRRYEKDSNSFRGGKHRKRKNQY